MATHVSATAHEETPRVTENALTRRAQSVINDKSIAGETIIDNINVEQTSGKKIEALTEMICRAGDEPSAALFVLMATLENSTDPKALSNLAKHLAFTRCGEFNVYGIVDAQIAAIESELFASDTLIT